MNAIEYLKARAMGLTEEAYAEMQARKQAEYEYAEKRRRLDELSKDMVQYIVGEEVPDYLDRKGEFIRLHNEIREYEGKPPRNIRG